MSFLSTAKDGSLLLRVHIQPRASKTKIVGLYDGTLKIAVSAPPVEGRANKEIIQFLAKKMKIPRSDVRVKSGLQSRRKSLELKNIRESEVRRLLEVKE
ncbi:hypothetical protein DGMP_00290 [Desulfomarina profundi]|uniref:UPF0235 protein DGMP_00290 n=1 Tax=Desulfomarina profundi TaxID=2772557 RepID=A0A8D5FQ20_9BACT|nr:DUF167 domain-containing protein [Desulfomarina profundi]BCL59336.1 hypothetical protein DGMP_00290 [Desulfomarina profundi]